MQMQGKNRCDETVEGEIMYKDIRDRADREVVVEKSV